MSNFTKATNIADSITGVLAVLGIAVSVQDVENALSIILLVMSIVSILVTAGLRLWEKIRKAKEDGKVTSDEVRDIADDVADTAGDIADKINDYKDDKEGKK